MMTAPGTTTDDADVDASIEKCLSVSAPTSFFLYAGAGSGKTRSLVRATQYILREHGDLLKRRRQRVAVITYTNAACDEIKQRAAFHPLLDVATIHAFCWALIKGYHRDIARWLADRLGEEIAELYQLQERGRRGSQAFAERERSIEEKQRRRAALPEIRRFVYSPTGTNTSRDSLNHSEVIAVTAHLLKGKPVLQQLLVTQYPFLLVDESQDTNRAVMEALIAVEAANKGRVCLGLFGDTMQRIYSDGMEDVVSAIGTTWITPEKRVNFRSPTRIVELVNKIRGEVDAHVQVPASQARGLVRAYLLSPNVGHPADLERNVRESMADQADDPGWLDEGSVKILTLEHQMAANRGKFINLFAPLHKVDRFRTGLLDGSLPLVEFFTKDVLPLVAALHQKDRFKVAGAVRTRSPRLSKAAIQCEQSPGAELQAVEEACRALDALCQEPEAVTLREVLALVASTKLFDIPRGLMPFAGVAPTGEEYEEPRDGLDAEMAAIGEALGASLGEMMRYERYMRNESAFGTHQGVKGLEFPRVMVVISDTEARGFLFSYEKLFGVKSPTRADLENRAGGKETAADRTRRLFYVTCSRATESLAVVCYSEERERLAEILIERKWFDPAEVIVLGPSPSSTLG